MASALWRLVGEVEDARAERLRVDELQRFPITPILEEPLPGAQDHGMNHEPELIAEVASKQRTDESAASEDRDVLFRPLRQFDNFLREGFPLIRVELFHSRGCCRVVETTYLGTLFM